MKRMVLAVALVAMGLLGWTGFSQAGRMPDPGIALDTAQAHQTVVYHDNFAGLSTAQVQAVASGGSTLILGVYDAAGNLVALNTGSSPSASWTPLLSQEYTIKVLNPNDSAVGFVIRTN
ncbi:MAG TPA: hypothetical protein VFA18_22465 [Gemmataceae bacterium]|nr:hypothetical protein [Gemmataceae bacterium]